MSTVYGKHERTADPLAVVTVAAGVIGALASLVLWSYQWTPSSQLLGEYSFEVSHGGQFRSDLMMTALALGLTAILSGLMSTLGARRIRLATWVGLILGGFAVSYPLLALAGAVDAPLRLAPLV
jgi:hypothetical protein